MTPVQEQPDAPAAVSPSQSASNEGLTLRAVLAGIVCVAAVSILVTWAELVLSTIRIGYLQLPPVAIGVLLLVRGIAGGLSRVLRGRWAFSPVEMVVVYAMCVIAAMVSSHGLLQKMIPLLVVPNYTANSGNNWANLFFRHVPAWAMPWDTHGEAKQTVSKWFYEGLPRGEAVPWGAWIQPCLLWGAFWLLIVWAFVCLTVLLRRQWADHEKLAFPLAQLPLEIIEGGSRSGGSSFWRNGLTWAGVALPVAVYGLDWLHQIMPALPLIPTSMSLNDYLGSAPPWNQIAYTPLIFSFAAVGFFYLLPTDMLLSIWFFFLLRRAEQLLTVSFNMDTPQMPMQNVLLFQGYQTAAAYLVLFGYFLWIARPHLRRVWGEAVGHLSAEGSADEMLSYRAAFWGLAGSLLGAGLFFVAMGMSPWFAALELVGGVLIIGVVMARTTAEAGMLMTEVTWSPVDLYALFGSVHSLGGANLTLAAYFDHLLVHDQRGLLLTGMLDSAWLGDSVRLRRKSLLTALLIAAAVALCVAGPLQIYLPYTYGGHRLDYWMENLSPQTQFLRYAPQIGPGGNPVKDAWQMPVFFLIGATVTLALVVMRSLFYWWPLHPLGYALAGSWSTIQFWFPCLIAWMLKSLSLRYGGIKFYTTARPFFLGLIVGEFGMAVLSALLSVVVFQASHQKVTIPTPPFPWQ